MKSAKVRKNPAARISEPKSGSAWFHSLIKTSQDAVIFIDRQGRIVLFNPAAERIFGYSRAEAEGQKIEICMAEPGTSEHDRYIAIFEKTGRARAIGRIRTVLARRKSGEVFPIEVSVAEVKVGNEIRYGAFIRDVSERETRVSQQMALAQIGQRALSVSNISLLFEEACALVATTLDVELCHVMELEPDGQFLRLQAGVGWKEGLVGQARVNAGLQSDAGYTLLSGEPVVVEDVRTESRFNGPLLLHDHGAVSGASIVIPGTDRPFGIFGAYALKRRKFSGNDLHFLKAVANILSQAIKHTQAEEELKRSEGQLRALAARLHAVREEERTLLAREIHDEMSGGLTALKMDISLLPDRAARDHGAFLEKLSSMSQLIDNTLDRVHAIVTELRPVVLDKLGLVAAMEWQAKDFQERSGIVCEIHLPAEEIPLDPDRSTAVFRIFQEALTNVARHADASKVRIDLRPEAEGLILSVRDNGKGLDEAKIFDHQSLGLLGMRERAQSFGGTVEFSGLPERGTEVRVRIPVK